MPDLVITVQGKPCPFCNKEGLTLRVWENDWNAYANGRGVFIQNAFPYLTADERESLQTGICNDCYPT